MPRTHKQIMRMRMMCIILLGVMVSAEIDEAVEVSKENDYGIRLKAKSKNYFKGQTFEGNPKLEKAKGKNYFKRQTFENFNLFAFLVYTFATLVIKFRITMCIIRSSVLNNYQHVQIIFYVVFSEMNYVVVRVIDDALICSI